MCYMFPVLSLHCQYVVFLMNSHMEFTAQLIGSQIIVMRTDCKLLIAYLGIIASQDFWITLNWNSKFVKFYGFVADPKYPNV